MCSIQYVVLCEHIELCERLCLRLLGVDGNRYHSRLTFCKRSIAKWASSLSTAKHILLPSVRESNLLRHSTFSTLWNASSSHSIHFGFNFELHWIHSPEQWDSFVKPSYSDFMRVVRVLHKTNSLLHKSLSRQLASIDESEIQTLDRVIVTRDFIWNFHLEISFKDSISITLAYRLVHELDLWSQTIFYTRIFSGFSSKAFSILYSIYFIYSDFRNSVSELQVVEHLKPLNDVTITAFNFQILCLTSSSTPQTSPICMLIWKHLVFSFQSCNDY